MLLKFLILLVCIALTVSGQSGTCSYFKEKLKSARKIENVRKMQAKLLEEAEFVQEDEDLGYARTEVAPCRNVSGPGKWYDHCDADSLTTTARLMADEDSAELKSFGRYFKCSGKRHRDPKNRSEYRAVDGYGNNLKNPYWGSTGAPFGRFGPKNYADGVHSIRKSVTGSELPPARKLAQNILMKAEIKKRTANIPNDMSNYAGLHITHDIAAQATEKLPVNKCEEIRCCFRENEGILPDALSNSACLPIPIPDDDPFYSQHDVKCLNFLRSEKTSLPSKVQFGEIKNKATGFLDLSLVYGNEEYDLMEVRSFVGGKLRMNSKNLMAIDESGDYSCISDRMRGIPLTGVLPTLFTRNHNQLADELARRNPTWNDEKLLQESRRINIAILQSVSLDYFNSLFGAQNVSDKYDETVDISSNVEFHSAAYRYFHFYINSDVLIAQNDGSTSTVKLSDTFGKMNVVEDNFDGVVNGFLDQSVNLGVYSDELLHHFAKREEDGVGVDVISFDIQRGRDHGVPTYLQTRKHCGLSSDFETFEDLLKIFPQSYVDLLSAEYASVKDIDLVVGGSLESFQKLEDNLVGETFECIIRDQFKRVVAGDAYFFTNPKSPKPFNAEQIKAIKGFSLNHLVCTNTGVQKVPQSSYYVESADNPKVPCSDFKPIEFELF